MLPAWNDSLLPDGQASNCTNGYLFSGGLLGWREPKVLRDLVNPDAKFVYRIPRVTGANQLADTSITAADSVWLEFSDRDTDVVRSPVVNDTFGRYYFASPSVRPKYNTYDRIVAGLDPWYLGVPAPGCPPEVIVAGGGNDAQDGFPVSTSTNIASVGANTIIMFKITPAEKIGLDDVSFMPASTDQFVQFAAVLYSDNAGVPETLLNVGAITAGIVAGTASSSPFVNVTVLEANTSYWIGIAVDTTFDIQLADDTGHTGVYAVNTFTNGPPAAMGSVSGGQPNWQMWVNLTTSAVLSARAYVYTWVTEYDEEGPPTDPTLVNGWSNGVWTINMFSPVASDMGVNRNITKKRLYRTISDQTGLTNYFFVAELPVTQETYVDIIGDDQVAINQQLVSSLWFEPPEDLQGIVTMPNGMMAGFKANEVWFCEPYRPHAWPPSYVLTTEFPIVGLGVIGQTLVVVTKGMPSSATGVNPSAMSLVTIKIPEPCLSRRSIVSTDAGVFYMSNNGIIQVTQYGQASNITELWITRERWAELTPATGVAAIKLASSYFAFGLGDVGFTIEMSASDQQSFTIWPQPGGHRLGFIKLDNDFNVANVEVDPWTGIGLLIQNGKVYYYDFTDQAPTIRPYVWRSKSYQTMAKRNFEAARVFFTVPPGTPALSATRNEAEVQTLAADQYLILRVYARQDDDMLLVTTREVRQTGELLRIVSGFKAEEWMFELEGRVLVSNMQVATSVKELARV
jgi:hypothetical protein